MSKLQNGQDYGSSMSNRASKFLLGRCMVTLKATAQDPVWLDRGYVYWKLGVQTVDGLPIVAVDIIGKMSAAAYIRLKARHRCPRMYMEFFVAHALQYDAEAIHYFAYADNKTYVVTVPDNIKVLERMFARELDGTGARG